MDRMNRPITARCPLRYNSQPLALLSPRQALHLKANQHQPLRRRSRKTPCIIQIGQRATAGARREVASQHSESLDLDIRLNIFLPS